MTGRDFCYWLQGYFEVTENIERQEFGQDMKDISLSENQIKIIRAHLNLVFKHEIDPTNLDGKTPSEKKEYGAIHGGMTTGQSIPVDGPHPYDIKHESEIAFNC